MNLNLRYNVKSVVKRRIHIPIAGVEYFLEGDTFYYVGRMFTLKFAEVPSRCNVAFLVRNDGHIFQGANGNPLLVFNRENRVAGIHKLLINAIQPYRFKKEELNQKLLEELAKFKFSAYEKDKYRIFHAYHYYFKQGEKDDAEKASIKSKNFEANDFPF